MVWCSTAQHSTFSLIKESNARNVPFDTSRSRQSGHNPCTPVDHNRCKREYRNHGRQVSGRCNRRSNAQWPMDTKKCCTRKAYFLIGRTSPHIPVNDSHSPRIRHCPECMLSTHRSNKPDTLVHARDSNLAAYCTRHIPTARYRHTPRTVKI